MNECNVHKHKGPFLLLAIPESSKKYGRAYRVKANGKSCARLEIRALAQTRSAFDQFTKRAASGQLHFKILKMIVTSGFLTALECTKFALGWDFAPTPMGELSALL